MASNSIAQPLNPHFLGIKQQMHNSIWLPFHQLSALKEQMMTQPGILGQKSNYCTILFVLRHLKSRKKFFPMCRFEERTSPRVGNTGLGCSYPRLRLGKELPQPCVSFPSSSVLSSNLHIGKIYSCPLILSFIDVFNSLQIRSVQVLEKKK